MPTQRKTSKRPRRSAAVPLTIVPALAALVAATGCSSDRVAYDPCEPVSYQQMACDSAVAHRGYWYSGTWYPHTYAYLPLYYFGNYNSYVARGGRVRSISPTVYSPSVSSPSRPNVVRGGFGGIGEGHGAAGS